MSASALPLQQAPAQAPPPALHRTEEKTLSQDERYTKGKRVCNVHSCFHPPNRARKLGTPLCCPAGQLLGQGACKKVFKAFDEAEGIEVAWNEVLVTDLNLSIPAQQETRDRVFSEIKLLKQLKHKNILSMHDWWLDTKNSVRESVECISGGGGLQLRDAREDHQGLACPCHAALCLNPPPAAHKRWTHVSLLSCCLPNTRSHLHHRAIHGWQPSHVSHMCGSVSAQSISHTRTRTGIHIRAHTHIHTHTHMHTDTHAHTLTHAYACTHNSKAHR
jgi:hypothetical protein